MRFPVEMFFGNARQHTARDSYFVLHIAEGEITHIQRVVSHGIIGEMGKDLPRLPNLGRWSQTT